MNIYPEDLGQGYCARILQWRGLMKGFGADAFTHDFRLGMGGNVLYGTLFGGLLGVLCANLLIGVPVLITTGMPSLFGIGCGYATDRVNFRKLRVKKLTEQELSYIRKDETDSLKKDYFGIITTLMALPSLPTISEEQSIRHAVRSLGLALEKLPGQPVEGAFADPATLNAEAASLVEKAENEADPVVAASLSRQAESIRRRAGTTARTAALARRNHILRQEIAGQVNAFQTSIAAASMNGNHEVADFEALAASVAQVAQEADALADARVELDTASGQPQTTAEPAALAVQTTRR